MSKTRPQSPSRAVDGASAAPAPVTFGYTGQNESVSVPANVTAVVVTAAGGAGGNASSGNNTGQPARGGVGALVTGTVPVAYGDQITVAVGDFGGHWGTNPSNNYGGWGGLNGDNSGAAGGSNFTGQCPDCYSAGGGGGGATVVQINGQVEVTAGGAGGGGSPGSGSGGDGGAGANPAHNGNPGELLGHGNGGTAGGSATGNGTAGGIAGGAWLDGTGGGGGGGVAGGGGGHGGTGGGGGGGAGTSALGPDVIGGLITSAPTRAAGSVTLNWVTSSTIKGGS